MFRVFRSVIPLSLLILALQPGLQAQGAKTLALWEKFKAPEKGSDLPQGWKSWSPRAEIAPRFSVDPAAGRHGEGALRIDGGGNPGVFGSWQHRVDGVAAGRTYRLTAYYRAQQVPQERRSITARLDWLDSSGRRARPPDYAIDAGKDSGWTRVEYSATAPANARSVVLELWLAWAPKGTVWWDDIRFEEVSSSRDRVVRAVTIYHRPRGVHSAAEAVEEFCRLIESAASQKPDVICLPEGITVIGTGKKYAEVSEPIPGPTTRRLGELARKFHTYIVAGIYERVEPLVYNTAVLIGRDGAVAGKYRKTHLPYEESEAGLTPGDTYPVFDTDFGKVGMMVCWDFQFPEPWRALALQGAELILLPIWGGSEILTKARAIENQVFLVSSSYDMKTFIVDPEGKVLAEANAKQPIAAADLYLDRKILQPWLGDMKTRTWKERRPDIPIHR